MTTNKEQLLPCPFCESHEVEVVKGCDWDGGNCYYVKCEHCGTEGPSTNIGDSKLRAVAISKWNTRAKLTSQVASGEAERKKAFQDYINYGQSYMLGDKHIPLEEVLSIKTEPVAWANKDLTLCTTVKAIDGSMRNKNCGFGSDGVPLYLHPPTPSPSNVLDGVAHSECGACGSLTANSNEAKINNINNVLVEALRKIAEGDCRETEKTDKCVHGKFGYENCESCVYDFAEHALATYSAPSTDSVSVSRSEYDAMRADVERMNYICDDKNIYWIHIQTEPSGLDLFHSGRAPELREAIDTARKSS